MLGIGRQTRLVAIASVFTVAALTAAAPVGADMVTYWNEVTLDAVRATSTNPPRATRALAMVHIAIFDAVNGVSRRYEPYLIEELAPARAGAAAAATGAAYRVLQRLFPQYRPELWVSYELAVASLPDNRATRRGLAWGRRCGRQILALRADDGSNDLVVYEPSGEVGFWQPTPPAFASALLPQWPWVIPFAMTDGAQFRVPRYTSSRWPTFTTITINCSSSVA